MSDATTIGPVSRLTRAALVGFYRRQGWRVEGTPPTSGRYVLIAAPHTSNWDFVYFLGVSAELGIMPNFLAKDSLFRWPIGGFMRDMGGIPVNRGQRGDMVGAMIYEFARRDRFALTIAPEGTRGKVGTWRTGFYHIALGAQVPIVAGFVDYATRTAGLGPTIMPSGDYDADIARIAQFYQTITPRYPGRGITDWGSLAGPG